MSCNNGIEKLAPVNRLTKNIALVLISSSLVLSGCGGEEEREDFGGGPFDSGHGTAYNSGYNGGHSSHIYYHNGSLYHGGGSVQPGSSFGHSFGSFGGSSHVGSTRGGFGASGHGAGA
jgi:hypothetical protein